MNHEELLQNYYKKYLNREPDKMGFDHYLSKLNNGELNEKTLEQEFTNSLEYKAKQLESKFKKNSETKIEINEKTFFVTTDQNAYFWAQAQLGIWEPETFKIFDMFLDSNHSYVDLGSWIGPTVLYGSQSAKKCYAIEPDNVAFQILKKNVELNSHLSSKIELFELCFADFCGVTHLTPRFELGDSMSNTIFEKTENSLLVNTTTFEQFLSDNSIHDCNFVKMDIEGSEFIVLPTMNKFIEEVKPTIHLSMHLPLIQKPLEKIKKIHKIISKYDFLYDSKLNILEKNFILNEDNFDKFFEVVVSDRKIY